MDIGSLLLILALLVLVGLFVSQPFFSRTTGPSKEARLEDHDRSSLMAEHERLLNALQELDFDHALGKIPAEDYPVQRTHLLRRGADVLRALDEIEHVSQQPEDEAESRLEAAVAARRADAARAGRRTRVPAVANQVAPDDQLEHMLADRRRVRSEKAGGFCPNCGGAVQKSDRFCPKCGATL
jgi:hypothetical protein